MTRTLVSIVIPVVERSSFLGAAIDSLLAQTHPFVDPVVVLRTAVADEEMRKALDLHGKRLRVLPTEEESAGAALGLGLREAAGDLVGWLAPDDLCDPRRLERQLAALAAAGGPAVVHSGIHRMSVHGRLCPPDDGVRTTAPDGAGAAPWRLLDGGIDPATLLVPRRCIDDAGGADPAFRSLPELDLALRLALRLPFVPAAGHLVRRREPYRAEPDTARIAAETERLWLWLLDRLDEPAPGGAAVPRLAGLARAWRHLPATGLEAARAALMRLTAAAAGRHELAVVVSGGNAAAAGEAAARHGVPDAEAIAVQTAGRPLSDAVAEMLGRTRAARLVLVDPAAPPGPLIDQLLQAEAAGLDACLPVRDPLVLQDEANPNASLIPRTLFRRRALAAAAPALIEGESRFWEQVRRAGRIGALPARPLPVPQWPEGAAAPPGALVRQPSPLEARLLVDGDWYRSTYPDVAATGSDPAEHYLRQGWREGRDPNPWFSTQSYLSALPDPAAAGLCPLEHFLREGGAQGLRPHPAFDIAWYCRRYLDSDQPTAEALRHFLTVGLAEGAVPSPLLERPGVHERVLALPVERRSAALPRLLEERQDEDRRLRALVDEDWYLRTYPDVAASGVPAVAHFLFYGWYEGRLPNQAMLRQEVYCRLLVAPPVDRSALILRLADGDLGDDEPLSELIDEAWYRSRYPDIPAAGAPPVMHYLIYGWREGRDPNPWFSTEGYRSAYPEVAAAGICPLVHFVQEGAARGCRPHPSFDIAWYSRRYLGSAQPTAGALRHFLTVGIATGAVPNEALDRSATAPGRLAGRPGRSATAADDGLLTALVDGDWYRTTLSDPSLAPDPVEHYRRHGWRVGLDPNPWFSTRHYLSIRPDAEESGLCPLEHFLREGAAQGCRPHPAFDIAWYSRRYLGSDRPVAEALRHFLTAGLAGGAVPGPDLDGPSVQDRLLATPPGERGGLLRRLHALAAGGPADWNGEDADLWPVWLTRDMPRHSSPVLVLCDGTDPYEPARTRLATHLLPEDEVALFGLVGRGGEVRIGDGSASVRFLLPDGAAAFARLLQTIGCRRAATLSPFLETGPVVRAVRDARIPLSQGRRDRMMPGGGGAAV